MYSSKRQLDKAIHLSFWSPLWKSIRMTSGWISKPKLSIDCSELSVRYLEDIVYTAFMHFYSSGCITSLTGALDKQSIIRITEEFVSEFFVDYKREVQKDKESLKACTLALVNFIDKSQIYESFLFAYRQASCICFHWLNSKAVTFNKESYVIDSERLQSFVVNHVRVFPDEYFCKILFMFLLAFSCSRKGDVTHFDNIEIMLSDILNRISPYFYYSPCTMTVNSAKVSMNVSVIDILAKKISISVHKRSWFSSMSRSAAFLEASEKEKRNLAKLSVCDVIRNFGVVNYLSPDEMILLVNRFIQKRLSRAIYQKLSLLNVKTCKKIVSKLAHKLTHKIDISKYVLEAVSRLDIIVRRPLVAILASNLNKRTKEFLDSPSMTVMKLRSMKKVFSYYFKLIKKFIEKQIGCGHKVEDIENSISEIIYVYKSIKEDDPQNITTSLILLNLERKISLGSTPLLYNKTEDPVISEHLPMICAYELFDNVEDTSYDHQLLIQKANNYKEHLVKFISTTGNSRFKSNYDVSLMVTKIICKMFKNKDITDNLSSMSSNTLSNIKANLQRLVNYIKLSQNKEVATTYNKQAFEAIKRALYTEVLINKYLEDKEKAAEDANMISKALELL